MARRSVSRVGILVALSGLAFACSPDKALQTANGGPGAAAAPPPAPKPAPSAAPASTLAKIEFGENDFVESDRNRDPFRSYAKIFVPEATKRLTQNQKAVVLGQYSLDELRLVAIVTGGEYPRAMMLDPGSKGWVIKRGDWVGRPEIVHTGGANGTDYQLHWRVERVRDGDIVFSREDPAQPGIPPASRVITLHPESENAKNQSLTD
jgi:type IV pilus assembly protein PilP